MIGVRLSLRVFSNLHFYSRSCQKSGLFTYSTFQCSTCWTHQRHLSQYLTNYSQTVNGLFHAVSGNLLAIPPGTICLYNNVRHKSKKSKKKNTPDATDEDEDEDEKEIDPEDSDYDDEPVEDPTIPKDYKDVEKAVQSFRFDVIFTAGLDMSRNKVEDAFYSGKLRLNGEKLWKKSRAVKVGDILDLIVEENREAETTTVMRTMLKEVQKEKTSTDKYKVVLRRWKKLAIPKSPEFPKATEPPSPL
ncbi:mitochondrial transcription rescue factor 1 [Lithobates pipiens]